MDSNQTILKLLICSLIIVITQSAFCQKDLKDLAANYYKTALRLENSDSMREATVYYKHVVRFVPKSKIGVSSKTKLDSIWEIEKKLYQEQFIGEWRWIWSGTNWGKEDSPNLCNCVKYWNISKDEIVIIEDDTLIERLSYKIEKEIEKIGSGDFMINIKDGENSWRIRIYQEPLNTYYLSERSKDAKFFMTCRNEGLIPDCVCGCPEERFEKK